MPDIPSLPVDALTSAEAWVRSYRTTQLREHFADVSSSYRRSRELDTDAVRVISGVLARAPDRGRPLRLLDVGTGAGRYLEAVGESLSATRVSGVLSIGLDLNKAMLRQAHIRSGQAGLRAEHLVSTVEMLPFQASSCDAITCFNAVHHFDLARFVSEASRVLTPSGRLVLYTRTPEQNRRTIWGRYFPEFATRENRLHRVADLCAALEATDAFVSVRAQTVPWNVDTSLSRLVEQVTHYHYSTFRMYSTDALQAAIDTFRRRVRQAFPDSTRVTNDNDHVVVIAERTATH